MPTRRKHSKFKKNKRYSKPLAPKKSSLVKNQSTTIENQNRGQNVKRIVSQRMVSHHFVNGKEKGFVDIFSALKKNNKSQILRHMNLSKNGKKKSSTVLVKHNGKQIKVLESSKNGKKVSTKKYSINNPEKLKEVFSVQSNSIKGSNVIKKLNLKKRSSNNNRRTKKSLHLTNVNNMNVNQVTKPEQNQVNRPEQNKGKTNPMVNLAKSLKEIFKPVKPDMPKNKNKTKKNKNKNKNKNKKRKRNRRH